MRKRFSHRILLVVSLFFLSCTPSVKQEDLYGEWKYIKVENINKNAEDSLSLEEVAAQSPAIIFSSPDSLIIRWGGKELSRGVFRLEGSLIRYKENLEGGATREFPFLIRKLTPKQLIFETMEQEGTRVTAQKLKGKN